MAEPSLRALSQMDVGGDAIPSRLSLALTVRDAEVIRALLAQPEGRAREEAALAALRIGVLALEHARGRVDADTIRREGERLVETLGSRLEAHREAVQTQVATALREYFDPQSGRFTERVERLVKRDGELEQVLRRQIGAEDSTLAKTLAASVGAQSPLLKLLGPDEANGVVHSIEDSVERVLAEQKAGILRQFSLDEKDGALSRLLAELTESHGKLTDALKGSVEKVVGEFSLDDENSALSRLVGRVESAQRQIHREFTLDDDDSALARMRSQLLAVLEDHRETATKFQEEVKSALAALQARREESLRSTRHGADFESALFDLLMDLAQANGDVATATGQSTGLIANSKVGDAVIEMGPDTRAAGARIVVEAKEDASYDLSRARNEMDVARKNRGASVGIFVYSRRTAPAGTRPLARYGNDFVVVWDAEDRATDVVVEAAIAAARAISIRAATAREERGADLEAIERAIRRIEKQADALDEIRRAAETVRSGGNRILERVRIAQEDLKRQVEALDRGFDDLKGDLGSDAGV